MPLAETAGVLQGQRDPRELIRRQLAQVEERIAIATRLRADLLDVLAALDGAVEPSAAMLVTIIEGMTTMNRPLTPEQLHELNEHRRRAMEQLTAQEREEMAARRRQWRESLSEEELAAAHRRRAVMLPPAS